MDKKETASNLFLQGFNCSQAVFSAFCEKYGLPRETALKISCGFGGGMRNGEVCGAVSGAILVIGLRYGHNNPEASDSKQLCYKEVVRFSDFFREKNNSIVCRDILGHDISTPDGMQAASEKGLFKTTCVDMVCNAIDILEKMGY